MRQHFTAGVSDLETKSKSLALSVERASVPLEVRVCKRDINLKKDVRGSLKEWSVKWDTLSVDVRHGIEEIYELTAHVLEIIQNEKHLEKGLRRTSLNALAALLAVANGLEERLESSIARLDSIESALIDVAIGDLIAVHDLDCDCACPVPKLAIELIENTVEALSTCLKNKGKAIRSAIDAACETLKHIIDKGVQEVMSAGMCQSMVFELMDLFVFFHSTDWLEIARH